VVSSPARPRFRLADARVVDAVLAAVVTLVSLVELRVRGTGTLPVWLVVPVHVVVTGSLAWRRTRPLVVGILVAGGALGLLFAGLGMDNFGLFVATLVSAYSMGAHTRGRAADPRTLVVWLVGVVAGALWAAPLDEAAGLVVLVTGTAVLGRLLRRRDETVAGLRWTANRLEAEREMRTRAALADERTRIARELHDVVAHSVSLMVLQTGAGRKSVHADPDRSEEMLRSAEQTGRQALAEMKRLVGIMRAGDEQPGLDPQPGLDRVADLVAGAEAAGVPVDYTVEGAPMTLPAGLGLATYRVVQEALTNAIKHAAASRIRVSVRYIGNAVELTVADDGIARQDLWPPPELGHGLAGMRERAALYGGTLTVQPRVDGGLVVNARFPVGVPDGVAQ
jgi:signal transduction histidine kinase